MAPKKTARREAPTSFRIDKAFVYRLQARAGAESVAQGRKVTMKEVLQKAIENELAKPVGR